MQTHHFKTEQQLAIDLKKAWDFFSSPNNLSLITPPELDFKVVSDTGDKGVFEGMQIDYIVKPLFRIPLKWKTEICEVKAPWSFTDRQVKGPFRLWEHSHLFIENENGILVRDHVSYQMPFGILGKMAHGWVVSKQIQHIFNYRKEILKKILEKNGNDTV